MNAHPINAAVIAGMDDRNAAVAGFFDDLGRSLDRIGRDIAANPTLQQVARGNPVLVVARNGFLLLLKEGIGGIAEALEKSGKMDDVKRAWEGMGGDWSAFMSAFRQGLAKSRAGVHALPDPWDWSAWQSLTFRDAVRRSLPDGLNPAWFGVRGIDGIGRRPRYDEDPNFTGPPREDARPVGNVWGTLSSVFQAAGPVLSQIFGAAGQPPPPATQQAMQATTGPQTPIIANEALNALLQNGIQLGTDAARRALEQATRPQGPPPPAPAVRRPPVNAPVRFRRDPSTYPKPVPYYANRRSDSSGALILAAAVIIAMSNGKAKK